MAEFSSYDLSGGSSNSSAVALTSNYATIEYSWSSLDGRFALVIQQSIDGTNFVDLKDDKGLVIKGTPTGTSGRDFINVNALNASHIRLSLRVDHGTTGTFDTDEYV